MAGLRGGRSMARTRVASERMPPEMPYVAPVQINAAGDKAVTEYGVATVMNGLRARLDLDQAEREIHATNHASTASLHDHGDLRVAPIRNSPEAMPGQQTSEESQYLIGSMNGGAGSEGTPRVAQEERFITRATHRFLGVLRPLPHAPAKLEFAPEPVPIVPLNELVKAHYLVREGKLYQGHTLVEPKKTPAAQKKDEKKIGGAGMFIPIPMEELPAAARAAVRALQTSSPDADKLIAAAHEAVKGMTKAGTATVESAPGMRFAQRDMEAESEQQGEDEADLHSAHQAWNAARESEFQLQQEQQRQGGTFNNQFPDFD